MNNEIKFLPPFKRMCMTIGTLPSSFYASMSYYESMVWLYEYLKNEVIPVVNNNSEVTKEIQATFKILEEFIVNYFDNLDVQEEVDKKLDEMAEEGYFDEIIESYFAGDVKIAFPYMNNDGLTEETNGDCTIIKTRNHVMVIDTYYKENNFVGIQKAFLDLNINKINNQADWTVSVFKNGSHVVAKSHYGSGYEDLVNSLRDSLVIPPRGSNAYDELLESVNKSFADDFKEYEKLWK